jgi:peptidoglycan L-alanyl-D-glutamate endopeptidase CwlK
MATLTDRDLERLNTCHPKLAALFMSIAKHYPLVVLEGHRGEKEQNAAFSAGKSQLPWPRGKHNAMPSLAVDVAPLPIHWNNREAFSHFAGFVQGFAECFWTKIRWGGDWDGDRNLTNNSFDDLVHFELVLPTEPHEERIA